MASVPNSPNPAATLSLRRIPPSRPRLLTDPVSPTRLTVPQLPFSSGYSSAATSPATSPIPSPPLPSAPSPLAVRPPMSRSHSHTASISKALSTSKSLSGGSHSPFSLTPYSSTTNVLGPPRRLLIPTVRHSRHPASALPSPRAPIQKSPQSKLSRSRASSVAPGVQPSTESNTVCGVDDWIGCGSKLEVVQENVVLEGYQLYAVEKWYVSYVIDHQALSNPSVKSGW